MKIKHLVVTIIVFAGTLVSCEHEEFFELTNPPEFPWLNVREFERAAVTPYHYSFYLQWGGFYYVSDIVIFDCMSDIMYRIPNASAAYPIDEVYFRQTGTHIERVSSNFNSGYDAITNANTALDFYYNNDGNPFPDASITDRRENVDRIAGELHFMRAFAYYYHAMRHCPPPQTEAFSTEEILPERYNFTDVDAALNPDFMTGEETYNNIVDDLKKAKQLLPERFIEGVHHPSYQYGRANKFTAHALLSKIYFEFGQWELAKAELDTVIDMNGGMYDLSEDPIEAWNKSSADKGKEVIWQALYYDVELNESPKEATLFTYLDYRAKNGGHGDNFRRATWHIFSFSNLTAQQVGWMDENLNVTQEALLDKRYDQLYHRLEGHRGINDDDPDVYEQQYVDVTEPRIWMDKYFRGPDGQYTNVPVLRLAEMYLTRSLIHFENGNLSDAASDLNVIRKRAFDESAAGVSYEDSEYFVTASNITKEMIHNERIKELTGEGDRLRYLQTLKMDIGPGERDGIAPVPYPYENMNWVLPQKEIDFTVE